MKFRPFILGLLFALLSGVTYSQASLPNFSFDIDLWPQGRFLQYRLSDQDGNDVNYEYFFVVDENTVETFGSQYVEPRRRDESANSSRYVFDWDTMMIRDYTYADHKTTEFSPGDARSIHIRNGAGQNKVSMEYEYMSEDSHFTMGTQDIEYRREPSFFGNAWAIEVVLVARYFDLNRGERAKFGIFSTAGYTEFDAWYEKSEAILNVDCARYDFRASGLIGAIFGPGGRIWVSKTSGDVIRYELDLALNNKKNLRMDLLESRAMSHDEWQELLSYVK